MAARPGLQCKSFPHGLTLHCLHAHLWNARVRTAINAMFVNFEAGQLAGQV